MSRDTYSSRTDNKSSGKKRSCFFYATRRVEMCQHAMRATLQILRISFFDAELRRSDTPMPQLIEVHPLFPGGGEGKFGLSAYINGEISLLGHCVLGANRLKRQDFVEYPL